MKSTHKWINSFLKYIIVGVITTFIYAITTIALIKVFNWRPITSSIIAYGMSFVFSFLSNHYFVFGSSMHLLKTAARFAIISGVGFGLTTLIIYITEMIGISYYYAIMITITIMPLLNYTLNMRWTWHSTKGKNGNIR